jgi:hypothetical protein
MSTNIETEECINMQHPDYLVGQTENCTVQYLLWLKYSVMTGDEKRVVVTLHYEKEAQDNHSTKTSIPINKNDIGSSQTRTRQACLIVERPKCSCMKLQNRHSCNPKLTYGEYNWQKPTSTRPPNSIVNTLFFIHSFILYPQPCEQ